MFRRRKKENTESVGNSPCLDKKLEAEKTIQELIEKSGFNIERISMDISGEKMKPFRYGIRLCGIGLSIDVSIDTESRERIRELQYDLYRLYNIEFEKDRNERNLDAINEVLFEQRKLALESGVLTLAYKPKHLTEESVKSYYGDYEEKYAPYIINLYDKQDNIVCSHVAKCIESEFVTQEGYRPLNITFTEAISEQDVPQIYALIAEILKVYNQYVIDDYEENKISEKYQHRHDFDPADL